MRPTTHVHHNEEQKKHEVKLDPYEHNKGVHKMRKKDVIFYNKSHW